MPLDAGPRLRWDINDPEMPQGPLPVDGFREWPDGHVRLVYAGDERRAQRHLSGWAMRNTNNHNGRVLKKSCLGVVLCARRCPLRLRPAICDKARRKQQRQSCPNCHSALELVPCRGHSGYPVTNFWRLEGNAIFFQAKGVHDHPRPESKSETEARRSASKRQAAPLHQPQHRRLRVPEVGETQEEHQLPLATPGTFDAISSSSFPIPDSDPCGPPCSLAIRGHVCSPLQKPWLPCGHMDSSLHAGAPGKDASRVSVEWGWQHLNTHPLSRHSCGLSRRQPCWKPALGTLGARPNPTEQLQGVSELPRRYLGPPLVPGASTLHTVITTTTKVSYQSPALAHCDQAWEASGNFSPEVLDFFAPCPEVTSPSGSLPGKVPGESPQVYGQALPYPQESAPPRKEGLGLWEVEVWSPGPVVGPTDGDGVGPFFSWDGEGF